MKNLSNLRQDLDKSREIVVPGKHGMAALIIDLKDSGIKAEAIIVHMHQG